MEEASDEIDVDMQPEPRFPSETWERDHQMPNDRAVVVFFDDRVPSAIVRGVPVGQRGNQDPVLGVPLDLDGTTPPGDVSEEDPVMSAYRLATSMRWCCIADFVVVSMLTFEHLWFLALLPFPVLCFVGVYVYRPQLICVFLGYFPLALALRCYALYLAIAFNTDSRAMLALFISAVVGGFLVELHLLQMAVRLVILLRSLSAAQSTVLRESTTISCCC